MQDRNFSKLPLQQALAPTQLPSAINQHDLMSPVTKKILMQKLMEVQEQIGD